MDISRPGEIAMMTADTLGPTQRQECIIVGRALIANGYQPGFAPYSPAFFRHLPDRFDHPPFPVTMLALPQSKSREGFEIFITRILFINPGWATLATLGRRSKDEISSRRIGVPLDRFVDWMTVQPVIVLLMTITAIVLFGASFTKSQEAAAAFWPWAKR